jgi:hypothetical protein
MPTPKSAIKQTIRYKSAHIGGAPASVTGASYITRVAESGLSNEFALDSLNAGLLATDGDGNLSIADAADLPSHTHSASDIIAGQLGLARGGTNADLSATGGANRVVMQESAGAAFTVRALLAVDIPSLTLSKITDAGTMASQNANAIVVTGGTLDGVTIGGTTPAAGTFTTLQTNGNTILGDNTADTLTINATAVSIPNNLNIDSNTLFIDAANNRVAINTTSFAAAATDFQVNGDRIDMVSAGSTAFFRLSNSTPVNTEFGSLSGAGYFGTDNGFPITIRVNSQERARFFTGGEVILGASGSSFTPTYRVHAARDSALTNTIDDVFAINHNTSGTAAAGFGARMAFQLESSTTVNTLAASIRGLWNIATHATRSGDLVLAAYNTTNEREGLRIRGGAAGAEIAFNGATPQAQSTGWAVSNVTTDKVFDANATTLDEIADVLGTLITYLIARGDIAA